MLDTGCVTHLIQAVLARSALSARGRRVDAIGEKDYQSPRFSGNPAGSIRIVGFFDSESDVAVPLLPRNDGYIA